MPTDEIIIRLFCMVDEQLGAVNKRDDALLHDMVLCEWAECALVVENSRLWRCSKG
jgi:hypothetical protein